MRFKESYIVTKVCRPNTFSPEIYEYKSQLFSQFLVFFIVRFLYGRIN